MYKKRHPIPPRALTIAVSAEGLNNFFWSSQVLERYEALLRYTNIITMIACMRGGRRQITMLILTDIGHQIIDATP